jgi:hypothetical protein
LGFGLGARAGGRVSLVAGAGAGAGVGERRRAIHFGSRSAAPPGPRPSLLPQRGGTRAAPPQATTPCRALVLVENGQKGREGGEREVGGRPKEARRRVIRYQLYESGAPTQQCPFGFRRSANLLLGISIPISINFNGWPSNYRNLLLEVAGRARVIDPLSAAMYARVCVYVGTRVYIDMCDDCCHDKFEETRIGA